jgi:uncharacterized membrane protein
MKASLSSRMAFTISRHWLLTFSLVYGLFVGLPILAPVWMHIGWEAPARVIYLFYSFLCHQLPDRSFFLFGPQSMADLTVIQAVWQDTTNPLVLRRFIGSPDLGWKVAWSDRMVAMYGSVLLAGWAWALLKNRIKALSLWGLALMTMPLILDGGTHFLSDFSGIDLGFRYSNEWLAAITNNIFLPSFYSGNALGSFNSWARLVTGVLFGAGIVWYGFPYLQEASLSLRKQYENHSPHELQPSPERTL